MFFILFLNSLSLLPWRLQIDTNDILVSDFHIWAFGNTDTTGWALISAYYLETQIPPGGPPFPHIIWKHRYHRVGPHFRILFGNTDTWWALIAVYPANLWTDIVLLYSNSFHTSREWFRGKGTFMSLREKLIHFKKITFKFFETKI